MRSLSVMLVATLLQLPLAFGQAVNPIELKGKGAKQVEIVRQHFSRVTARVGESDEDLKMIPVLFWNAPSRGASDGKMVTVLFVEQGGRPEIACCVYPPIPSTRMTHEFGSLSSKQLSVKIDGVEVWKPRSPGVEFKTLKSQRPPAKRAAARLSEMKNFARQFNVEIFWRGVQREQLRLLPQPLYRYETGEGSVIVDGAVFCFVMGGVDPEALLLIEAVRPAMNKEPVWQYGFARRSSAQITATRKAPSGEAMEVWATTQLQGTGRNDPFIQIGVASK